MHSEEKPSWLKVKAPVDDSIYRMRDTISRRGLKTVCTASRCPNVPECWGRGEATFMILGGVCTRACSFCSVSSSREGEPVDKEEPERIARAVEDLDLKHAVITSVTRDDHIKLAKPRAPAT